MDYVAALTESLAEAMLPEELEPALEILRDTVGAADAGYFRAPRTATSEAAKQALAGKWYQDLPEKIATVVKPGVVILRLDDRAGIVVKGSEDTARVDACAAAFNSAHRRLMRFASVTGQNSGLTALIEKRLGACAALASAKGEVLWMSDSARDVLGPEGKTHLEGRLADAMRTPGDAKQFVLNMDGKHRLFGAMSMVRETPETSVHYIAVELHGTDVESSAAETKLTRSEREVYKLLMQGMSNEDIAKARFVSIETVRTHVKGVFKKMGVSSRVELLVKKEG